MAVASSIVMVASPTAFAKLANAAGTSAGVRISGEPFQNQMSGRRRQFSRLSSAILYGYFAPEGGFTAGPLLLPGSPGILDESCWRTARLWSLMSEPVVSDEDFAAGPLLLPGLPGMPGPEFCPLGMVTWSPPEGAVVCAEAGSVTIASAIAPVSSLNMANSFPYDNE